MTRRNREAEVRSRVKEMNRLQEIEREQRLAQYEFLLRSTRAGKLLLKGKQFLCVAMDEPYYADVYRTIRRHEKQHGRWNAIDESEFQTAMQMWMDFNSGMK